MKFIDNLVKRVQSMKAEDGQATLQGMLAVVLLVFIVFTVGNQILNNTALDPDSTNGGTQNSLTNIGLVTLSAVVIIAGMAGIILRLL